MRIVYADRLNKTTLLKAQIELMFINLEDGINTSKLDEENINFMAVNYRHFKSPMGWSLFRYFDSPLTFSTIFSSYYVINETVCSVVAGIDSADNIDSTSQPVIQVEADLFFCDCADSCTIGRACIGYSTDGGTTWIPLTDLSRPTGPTCGDTQLIFLGVQAHYWDGTPTSYYPFNQPRDPAMVLLASFGGDAGVVDPTTITHICVMTDSNVVGDSFLGGMINVVMRDNTQ